MMRHFWKFYGLYSREVSRFFLVPLQTIVTPGFTSFLYLVIFGITIGHMVNVRDNIPYLVFLIPGIILMSLIRGAFENASSSIMIAKYTNEFQDLKTSPLSAHHIIFAKSLSSVTRGLCVTLINLAIGYALYYASSGQWVNLAHPFLFIFMCLFLAFIFSNLGIAFACFAKSYDHVSGFNMLVLMPMIYLGGVFYDIERLPDLWKNISAYNPIVYMMEALRFAFFDFYKTSFALSFFVTFISFIISYFLAYYGVSRTKNYL